MILKTVGILAHLVCSHCGAFPHLPWDFSVLCLTANEN